MPLRVDDEGLDAALGQRARQLVEQARQIPRRPAVIIAIFAEVSPHASFPCEPETSRPVASIRVEWTATQDARVRVDFKKNGAHYVVARDVDLTRVARDTVSLTIAIAADELLREARDRATAHDTTTKTPPAPSSAPPTPSSASRPPPPPERA